MKPIISHLIAAMIVGVLVAMMPASDQAFGDEKGRERGEEDHDKAFRARRGGSILSLARVMAMVRAKIDGQIIETDFEYEHGVPVYEFKYVNRRGQVRELYADARDGTILKDEPD